MTKSHTYTRRITYAAITVTLMIAGAYIKIPFFPVPITLQNLFSILAGVILGWKYGVLSQIIYITLGLIGLPVFSSGGGIGYIFNPTFGYLLGFVLCTCVVGIIVKVKKIENFIGFFTVSVIGMICVYAIGVPYLFFVMNIINAGSNDFTWFLTNGFLLFVPGDILKCILAAFVGKFISVQYKIRLV